MGEEMLLLIAACVLLILYLSARLWIAEHDRKLLLERSVVVPVDYGAGLGLLLVFLILVIFLGIAILWLIGAF